MLCDRNAGFGPLCRVVKEEVEVDVRTPFLSCRVTAHSICGFVGRKRGPRRFPRRLAAHHDRARLKLRFVEEAFSSDPASRASQSVLQELCSGCCTDAVFLILGICNLVRTESLSDERRRVLRDPFLAADAKGCGDIL